MPSVFTPLPPADVFGDFQMPPQVIRINMPVLFPVLTLLDMKYQAAGAHEEPLFCLLDEK